MEKKKLILLLLSCAVITEAHAAYQGHVYVDSNRNGIYDKGEKVLKGIRVSDGLNVVKTNAEGVYTLPGHKRERFIFITTPSGYRTDNQYYRRINGTGQTYDFGRNPGKDASSRGMSQDHPYFLIPRYQYGKPRRLGE